MSFFGFDNNDQLEKEKEKFRKGGLEAEEDLAVYNWGESDYDGLGEALQEGADELDDETFNVGPVGKDFDLGNAELPESKIKNQKPEGRHEYQDSLLHGKPSRAMPVSLESIWDDKSPTSVLTGSRITGRVGVNDRATPSSHTPQSSSVAGHNAQSSVSSQSAAIRTLQEIEAEMRAKKHQTQALTPPTVDQSPVVKDATAYDQVEPHQIVEPSKSLQQHQQASSQISPDEIEQQLYLMHLSQLRNQEMQRNEQRHTQQQQSIQQQQLYQQPFQHQQLHRQAEQQRLEQQRQLEQQHLEQQRQLEQQQLLQQQLEQQRQLEQQQQLEQQRQLEQQQLLQIHLEQQQQIQEQLDRRHVLEQRHRLLQQQLEHEQLRHLRLQQQQQQLLLGSLPHSRQQNLRTPDRFNQQAQIRGSFPNTPEPPSTYMTAEQQAQFHMQQQLLLQLSRAGVAPDQIHLLDPLHREAIMNEARKKILAAEKLDQRNRRRLAKMERMARYNDLMTQPDKDFITRIQVSQLVTADPYVEDFYAQVLNSLRRNGPGMKFGNTGVSTHRLGGRREHAMNRMAEQVYRIVENAKAREKEKDQSGVNPLQGVLGKTSGRSYKAAPRQLLQVNISQVVGSPSSSPQLREAEVAGAVSDVKEQQKASSEKSPPQGPATLETKEPLTRRQALVIIESLFDHALNWENNRRFIPEDNPEAFERWQAGQKALEAKMWEGSQVTAPLDARYPHPLVSILTPLKGMKVMKRLTRVMDARQLRITMTLVTRLFADFDVIQNYHNSESLIDSKEKNEMERRIHVFEEFVLEAILPALAVAPLPVVSGQLQLLRNPVQVARTRPGIILLTNIFTRAAIIKDRTLTLQSGGNVESPDDVATPEEFQEWQNQYNQLFDVLAPHFLSFFPSTRVLASLPFGVEHQLQTTLALDAADEPVWSFFASMAVPAMSEQQQILVTQLREKVLENVLSAQQGWVVDENERTLKLRNVNMFLHALGLDSSQISL